MNQRHEIDAFFLSKIIAVAGVSRNKNKFGSVVYRELKKKGYNILPMNPNCDIIDGEKCYKQVSELPADVEGILCVVKPDITEELVRDAEYTGIGRIWMQPGSESTIAMNFCRERGIGVISKSCILMYAEPVQSIHKFHRGLARLFGRYNKQV
ncbi:MAG: CoA-binding protein [Spirochaetales bacterium]|nr:CoA-binding protein [Spirochaetales bacterium]